MAFNVTDLSAEIARNGVMRNNKFLVTFPIPLSLRNIGAFGDTTNQTMSLYCEGAGLPGAALMVEEVRRYGYGPNEKKPYVPIFTDLSLTFRGDSKGKLWTFLNQWMRCAINLQSALDFNTVNGPITNQFPNEVGYKYDPANNEGYASDVTITLYDDRGRATMMIALMEAFPIFVGDIPLNWANRDDYMRIPVTMAFYDWYNISNQIPNPTGTP